MKRHQLISVALLALFAAAHAQNQPLDVKEGLWDLTVKHHVVSDVPPETLANLPPAQRAQILAAIKAAQDKGQIQKLPFCLTHQERITGSIFGKDQGCIKQIASDGQHLNSHFQCGKAERTTIIDRVNAENFNGSQRIIENDDYNSAVSSTFTATWAGDDCSAVIKGRIQTALDKRGVDRDVLTFMPWIPTDAEGHLGRYFRYYWGTDRNYPIIGYVGGFPGAPATQMPDVIFNGTDGTYVYITLPGGGASSCVPPAKIVRVDHSGNASYVDQVPKAIHGGMGPPCMSGTH